MVPLPERSQPYQHPFDWYHQSFRWTAADLEAEELDAEEALEVVEPRQQVPLPSVCLVCAIFARQYIYIHIYIYIYICIQRGSDLESEEFDAEEALKVVEP